MRGDNQLDLLGGLLLDSEPFKSEKKYSSNFNEIEYSGISRVFQGLSEDDKESILGSINDIKEMIDVRKALTYEIFRDVDKIKLDIDNFILKFGDSADSDNLTEQLKLRKKQVEIDAIKIQEKLNSWRDIAQLKKELREHMKELREKESSSSMIDRILDM